MECQEQFDGLSASCAAKGLFINPFGELESMLNDCGIAWASDKRQWITQARRVLPNLSVDERKYPWRFIKSIHENLVGQKRLSGEADVGASVPS